MEVNEAKRLKGPRRENTEHKKMLAEAELKNRVLEFVCEKKTCEPGTSEGYGEESRCLEEALRAGGVRVRSIF